jgi:hypothetical protein
VAQVCHPKGACMRPLILTPRTVIVPLAAAAAILFAGCNDSNDVTGPAAAAANVSGNWSGEFNSYAPASCSSRTTTVSLTQTGNEVGGTFQVLGCGIDGTFRATIMGDRLTGSVGMPGCTGGAVNGRLEDGALSLTIGDFQKDLIAGDVEVLPGGLVRLQR